MRVVAGSARGRRLVAPPGNDVRPTLDRVRESLFNALGSMEALQDAVVADLFAGSGALGIEALSRGADRVTFVDSARGSIDAVEANLRTTGLGDRAAVVRSDVFDAVAGGGRAVVGPLDLVLADPPYAFDRWHELLTGVVPLLAEHAVVVAESDRSLGGEDGELAQLLGERDGTILRERRYGGTVVTMMTFTGSPPTLHASDPIDRGADS